MEWGIINIYTARTERENYDLIKAKIAERGEKVKRISVQVKIQQ